MSIKKVISLLQNCNLSSEEWTKNLQRALRDAGYTQNSSKFGIDGDLGKNTRTDVVDFIQDNPSVLKDISPEITQHLFDKKWGGRIKTAAESLITPGCSNPLRTEIDNILNGRAPHELSRNELKDVQKNLKILGEYTGKIDGIPGPLTSAAYNKHQIVTQDAGNHAASDNIARQKPSPVAITNSYNQSSGANRLKDSHLTPDQLAKAELREMIRNAEHLDENVNSSKCYDMSFGSKDKNFTNMTINEVMAWQKQRRMAGDSSTVAGAYQIHYLTLKGQYLKDRNGNHKINAKTGNKTWVPGLKEQMGLSGNELFDEEMQDRMADHLIDQQGYNSFVSGRKSLTQYMKDLSKIWASIPKDGSGLSFYHGDGLNSAQMSSQDAIKSLVSVRDTSNQTIHAVNVSL